MKPMIYHRFELASIVRQYPLVLFPLLRLSHRLRGGRSPALITAETELVLEGYFRTGNTFASLAFFLAQPRPTKVANHSHAIATLLEAAGRNLPTLVLVRQPADTAVSAVLKIPGTTLAQHLKWYIRYYECVERLRDHFYTASFDELIADFGLVIERLNRRFGTAFVPFEHTEENAQRVLDWIEEIDRGIYADSIAQYSIPLQEKREARNALLKELEKDEHADLLSRANHLYEGICTRRTESLP